MVTKHSKAVCIRRDSKMSTYYKHQKKETIDVPYSFRCEQCMKDSGALTATISGMQAEINSNFKNLNDKNQKKLNEMAHANLVREVKDAYQKATERQIYSKAFKDECPHCHKPQSWAISGAKNEMFSTPIVLVILGIIIGAGCYFFSGVENNLTIAIAAVGIFFVLALGSLIVNIVKIESKKKKTSASIQKNLPVIEWNAVQRILNE